MRNFAASTSFPWNFPWMGRMLPYRVSNTHRLQSLEEAQTGLWRRPSERRQPSQIPDVPAIPAKEADTSEEAIRMPTTMESSGVSSSRHFLQ